MSTLQCVIANQKTYQDLSSVLVKIFPPQPQNNLTALEVQSASAVDTNNDPVAISIIYSKHDPSHHRAEATSYVSANTHYPL